MHNQIINRLIFLLTIISCCNLYAATGPLVTIIGSGTGGDLDVNVWLNGYSPLSGQHIHITGGNTLKITPTHPTHYYPAIGIEVVSPGKSIIAGCSQYLSDRCIVSASNISPATVIVSSGKTLCQGPDNACRSFLTNLRITGDIKNATPNQPGAQIACPLVDNVTERANCLCQYDAATNQGLTTGTYKAWISTEDINAKNNINYTATVVANLPYVTTDGTLIAAAGQLTTPPLTNPIAPLINLAVWTGTTTEGVFCNTDSCSNWTTQEYTILGTIGNPQVTTSDWTDETSVTCAARQPLYCFEAPQ